MRRARAFLYALAGLAAAFAAAPPARGQQPAPGKAEAQALFEQAKARAAREDYAHACPLFAASQRIDPGLGTMLWLADCYENNGQLASAWAQFKEAEGVAARRSDSREKIARDHAAALEGRLAKIVVHLPTPAIDGLRVERDGRPVPAAEMGIEVPVDPGRHTVHAEAPGKKPWTTTVDVPPRAGVVPVDIPALEGAPPLDHPPPGPGAKPAASPSASPVTPVPSDEGEPGRRTLRIGGIAAGAAGVAAFGAAVGLTVAATSKYNDANDGPCSRATNACSAPGLAERHNAINLANGATALDVVGAVAVAGGAVLFILGLRHPSPASAVSPREPGVASIRPTAGQGPTTGLRWEW